MMLQRALARGAYAALRARAESGKPIPWVRLALLVCVLVLALWVWRVHTEAGARRR